MGESVLAHWDEIEVEAYPPLEHLRGRYRDLGAAAGSDTIGCGRWEPAPGCQSTPAHREGAEEEIYVVLAGSGWSWQDGATYAIGAGDVLVHRADEEAHTLVAGDDGLDVLAFGPRAPSATTQLPRAGVLRAQETWVELPGGAHPWEREDAAGRVELGDPQPRPDRIVALGDVPERRIERGRTAMTVRDCGRAAGSRRTGLRHLTVDPGAESYPPHCHSAEEELFVVLEGDGFVVIGEEEHPVRRGSVVSRPAGTRVAHSFRAGDEAVGLLAYGTRDPRDVAFYPRSGKLYVRGLGLVFRPEPLDYWDGEE